MQSAAHCNAERAHRFGYRGSAAHRPRRTVEGRHEAVAEVLDLAPAKPLQLLPHRLVVAIEQRAPLPVAKLGGAPRRIDMSVNMTVASTRSTSCSLRDPVRNSWISSTRRSPSPTNTR